MPGKDLPKMLRGTAQEDIAFGQHVLIRQGRCFAASPEIANGIARTLPAWTRQKSYKKGDFICADAITDAGQRDVHALAQLPIMDAVHINLPAGKVPEPVYQERLKLQFRDAGIEP